MNTLENLYKEKSLNNRIITRVVKNDNVKAIQRLANRIQELEKKQNLKGTDAE